MWRLLASVLDSAIVCLPLVTFWVPPTHGTYPAAIGHFAADSGGDALDFDTDGRRGYLVTRQADGPEFFVLDLKDSGDPIVLGSLDFPGNVNRVAVRGGLAYLATSMNDRELVIVDVSDPRAPRIVGTYDADSNRDAISLEVVGSLLFLGTYRGRRNHKEIQVLDISTPRAPVLLDSIHVDGDVNDLAGEGAILYAATDHHTKEVIAFDLTARGKISERGSIDLPGSADARGIAVRRGLVYAVTRTPRNNFYILDGRGLAPISTMRVLGRGEKVRVFRDRAYVAAARPNAGLQIIDVGDPRRPKPLHFLGREEGTNVRIDPPYTYLTVANRRGGLVVFDTRSLLRPNVVVIYTDDQHVSSAAFMPTLQEVASRGVTFRQAFVTTPVCGPSRASLLTGLYTHRHGAILNSRYIGWGPGAIGSDRSTVATWLQEAGYRTGFFGKYLNGYDHQCRKNACTVPPGWNVWQAKVMSGPGHIYYNYGISNDGTLEQLGNKPEDYSTEVVPTALWIRTALGSSPSS